MGGNGILAVEEISISPGIREEGDEKNRIDLANHKEMKGNKVVMTRDEDQG